MCLMAINLLRSCKPANILVPILNTRKITLGILSALSDYIRLFHTTMANKVQNFPIHEKSIDSVLGIQTRDSWMV